MKVIFTMVAVNDSKESVRAKHYTFSSPTVLTMPIKKNFITSSLSRWRCYK